MTSYLNLMVHIVETPIPPGQGVTTATEQVVTHYGQILPMSDLIYGYCEPLDFLIMYIVTCSE